MQVTKTQRITKREDLAKLVVALETDLEGGPYKKKAGRASKMRKIKLT